MDNPIEPKKSNKNLWITVIVVVVVIVLIGSFIGLDYNNLVKPSKSSASTLYVYSGVSGPKNSDHLLGGCVVAEMRGGSAPAASAQLMAYLLNPAVQKACSDHTGFIAVDTGAYTSSPSTSVPTIYSSSNATVSISYYTSISTSDEAYVTSVINNFMKEYKNIKVTPSFITASSMVEEISSLVTGHSHANVVMTIDNLDVGVLFYDGYLANLTSIAPRISDGQFVSQIATLNNYETHVFGGIYFFTQLTNIPLVWIDYTALQGAGISQVPTTYTQLYTDAKILDQKYGVGEVNFQGHGGASTPTELYQWMVQFGGNPMLFNDTGDIQAMSYIYNLSAYFSPDYTTSYWATYTGLASNSYTVMYYQWPGSVNLTKLGMTPYNATDTVSNQSLAAMKLGVFLRSPVAWIGQWQTFMDKAWVKIVEDKSGLSNIPSILSTCNSNMAAYLASNYNSEVAANYTAGMYAPVMG